MNVNRHLQVLDVHVVDVLSHLEALLRHSHTIQRNLLKLRSEAPPPTPASIKGALPQLDKHSLDMQRECDMLGEIIQDLATGIGALAVACGDDVAER